MISHSEAKEIRDAIVVCERINTQTLAVADISRQRLDRLERREEELRGMLLAALELFVAEHP